MAARGRAGVGLGKGNVDAFGFRVGHMHERRPAVLPACVASQGYGFRPQKTSQLRGSPFSAGLSKYHFVTRRSSAMSSATHHAAAIILITIKRMIRRLLRRRRKKFSKGPLPLSFH